MGAESFSRSWRAVSLLLALLFGVAVSTQAPAAGRKDPGVITLATDVRSGPGVKDKVVATVPAGHRVTVVEMAGSKARIESKTVKGWVPASKVRIGDGSSTQSSSGGGSFFRDITALLGGGKDRKDVKVTAGARGLTPGALEGASPNPAARKKMEANQVSRADAQKFGKRGRLVARRYDYLASGASTGNVFQGGGTGGSSQSPASSTPER